ncbi:Uncharacterized protein BP5553_10449 [Venustampulla echinocandica]|uniref:HTH TFE/IIEalpha-type domain-containing protein n=1 Tax=Venustampulla echinocandica TaxID=2656787 RepID=A0A370T9C0_9HELO|nr:Uncharacterized protein BP5553_10449 [Venustampulla echinocandica]RDL30171.1 Uncharacterized protein BP5553_10449 [Venustampulla echinocandica]
MDLAQMLVRSCMRAFCDTKHTLVIDALIIHSALRDDDLAWLMGMNTKEIHKLCGKLREDRFLTVHTRAEVREGQQRPVNKIYYFIDYRAAIDAIKWRVYNIDKDVQGNTVPVLERKEWFCSRCKSEWTTMEVLDKRGPGGFLCHKCSHLLQQVVNDNRGGHEKSTKLNAQFKFITDLLPKIDQVVVPENTFDKAYASAVKVNRPQTHLANETTPLDAGATGQTSVKGMVDTGPKHISITLTASEGPTEAEVAAERARKEKTAAQNVLPVHFTHSTITGEQVKFDAKSGLQSSQSLEPDKKDLGIDSTSANGDSTEIDDYFARLKAEQAKEAEQEQDEEYETDDEEEEDFEDVVPNGTGSGAATPASSSFGEAKPTSAPMGSGLAGVLKKGGSFSGSGTSTGVTSPVTVPNTPNEDGRPAKKVRIEEPVAKDEEESEEDFEFEDV